MTTPKFNCWADIPTDFEGKCLCQKYPNVWETCWFKKNKLFHRVDGPAIITEQNRVLNWYQNGVRHRLDGPAIEYAWGYKSYYINGKEYTISEYIKNPLTINFLLKSILDLDNP